jgi:hypothetical protein
LISMKNEDKFIFMIELFLQLEFSKNILVPIALKSEVDFEAISQAISKIGYSTQTANRRAQTIISWFRQAKTDRVRLV